MSAGPLGERGWPAPPRDRSAPRGPGLGLALGLSCGVPGQAAGARAWPGGGAERSPWGKGGGGGGASAGLPSDTPAPQCAQADDWRSAKAIYDFHALDIDGNDVSLEKYR